MNSGHGGARIHLYLGNMQLSQVEGNGEPEPLSYPPVNLRFHNTKDTMESTVMYKHALCSPGICGPGEDRSVDSLSSLQLIQSSWKGGVSFIEYSKLQS